MTTQKALRDAFAVLAAMNQSRAEAERQATHAGLARRLDTATEATDAVLARLRPNPALPSPEHDHHGGTAADPLYGDWRAMATRCTKFPHLIDKWEWEFLSGLQRFPRLSTKQHAILVRIMTRLRAAGCSL